MTQDNVSSLVTQENAQLKIAKNNLHIHVEHPPHSKYYLPSYFSYLVLKCNNENK